MLFLDAIGTPYYLILGGSVMILSLVCACLIGLTVIIFALFQRFMKKKETENKEEKNHYVS